MSMSAPVYMYVTVCLPHEQYSILLHPPFNELKKIEFENLRKTYIHYVQVHRRHYSSRNFGRLTTRPTLVVSTGADVVSTGAGGFNSVDGVDGD